MPPAVIYPGDDRAVVAYTWLIVSNHREQKGYERLKKKFESNPLEKDTSKIF